MRNKTGIIALTVLISVLCLYYLSFTYVARGIQRDATRQATDASGQIDLSRRQAYLDSLWNEPVYNLGFTSYTFKEVLDRQLNLGLDLQGGMHVTMEVVPANILEALSGNSQDASFREALRRATAAQRTSQARFTDLFYQAYQDVAPDGRLSRIFATSANRGRINFESTNQEVMRVIDEEVEDAIARSYEILRTRIDRFGVANPNIQRQPGSSRIMIELPGVDNPARVRKLLSGMAKLEFAEVWELQEIAPYLEQLNTYLINNERTASQSEIDRNQAQAQALGDTTQTVVAPDAGGIQADTAGIANDLAQQLARRDTAAADSLAALQQQNQGLARYFVPTPGGLAVAVRDTARVNEIMRRSEVRNIFPSNMRFLWSAKPVEGFRGRQEYVSMTAVKIGRDNRAAMEGDVIANARQDFSPTGQVEVNMQMNATGARKWRTLTANNIGRRIAIILDNYVYSAPTVQSEIPNGSSVISGSFSIEEAQDLANILRAGKLEAPTRIVEEAIVGPSLGRESITQGLISVAAGMGLVVLFMILYYGTGGMVANIALLVNIFFIIGLLAQFGAALTLPGIAGIVLTIGMAVDANVLIFERIKEELRNNNKSFMEAIRLGYDKAYSAILDSNATTFLTGVILFAFGTGAVRGFAVTLMIGIACSLFTAVFITRMIVEWNAQRNSTRSMALDTVVSKNLFKGASYDFVGLRKKAYIFSAVFIAIGMGALAVRGLNLGVDFQGGRTYIVRFDQPVSAVEVRSNLLDDFQNAGTEVKSYNGVSQMKITTTYLVDDESETADQQVEQALLSGLQPYQNLNPEIISQAKVGATIADDIKDSSRTAVIFSLIVIFLYILIRFRKWQYSLGALVALAHDVLIVLSAFAIARLFGLNYEVDQVFIAAMLTVIGYSINDTVVVFDRIREFANIYSRQELATVMNDAISRTLSRTIMTSFVTLLVVLVLFLFGGEVLRGFSFALLVGIIMGTYSSIFVAAPVVLDLSRKKLSKQAAG